MRLVKSGMPRGKVHIFWTWDGSGFHGTRRAPVADCGMRVPSLHSKVFSSTKPEDVTCARCRNRRTWKNWARAKAKR